MWKDVALWGLGIAMTVILGMGGYFGKTVTTLLKGILGEIKKLTGISVRHDERINNLHEKVGDHEDRIRELEQR